MHEIAELLAIVYQKHGEQPLNAIKSSAAIPQRLQLSERGKDQKVNLQVKQILEETIFRAKMIRFPKIKCDVWLHVWDSGGQPVFLDVLPAFLTSHTMFLLLFDASQKLSSNWKVQQYLHGKKSHVDSADMSTLDLLQQWMMAIYCHVTKRDNDKILLPYPQIILVGTHGDKANKATVKEEVQSSCINEKIYYDILAIPLLFVDNTTAGKGKDEDPGFEVIRKKVHEMTSEKLAVKTPVTWVLFRKVLQKLNRNSLSFSDVSKVAATCYIPEKAVSSVLTFYHELGVLLFYGHIKSLQDVVIVNPKWLVSQLGELLTLKNRTQYNRNGTLWELFFKKGILVEPLYKVVWERCGINPDALVDLLVHFHLAAPIPHTGQHNLPGEVKEFFLPCVLKYYKKKAPSLQKMTRFLRRSSYLKVAPLYVIFNRLSFFPPGFFTRLVPTLATKKQGKEVLYKIDFDQPVFRSRVTFSCQDPNVDKVTLTEMSHALEIGVVRHVLQHPQSLSSVCLKLLHTIEECCKEVHSCMYGSARDVAFGQRLQPAMELKWEYALLCQSSSCPSRSFHYCYFTPGARNLLCTKGTPQFLSSQMYWLNSEIPSTAATQSQFDDCQQVSKNDDLSQYDGYDEEPGVGDLMRWISPKVATQWNHIGVGLNVSHGVLDDICKDHPMPHNALEAVFIAWQKTSCSPYTWTTILKVLASREVGHGRLADDIADKLTCTQSSERNDTSTLPHVAIPCDRYGSGETDADQPLLRPSPEVTDSTLEEVLGIEQLADIKKELPYFTKWKQLGENLGLSPGKLEVIEADYKGSDEYLHQVLQEWLKQNYSERHHGPPTWSRLVEALKPIDHALATKIQTKHCPRNGRVESSWHHAQCVDRMARSNLH